MQLRKNSLYTLIFFAVCALLFVAVRARWIGHLLTWDEAMNLCSIRSFVSEGEDVFSFWFWRHPPLFCILTLPLMPLRAGFAERAEGLAIAVALVTFVMLFVLNRRVFVARDDPGFHSLPDLGSMQTGGL